MQIKVIGTDLVSQEQAFVDHGAAGHAGHVIFFAVRQVQILDGGTGSFANDIQLAFQSVLHDDVVSTANKNLLQDRLFFAHRGRHGHFTVHRHIAPAQQHLAFRFHSTFKRLLARQARGVFFRQKHHAHAVFAGGRQRDRLLGHFFTVQRIRQLNQNASAIAHQLVSTHSTPMVQVFKNFQALLHDRMRLVTLDVRDKTHAASVMLVGR